MADSDPAPITLQDHLGRCYAFRAGLKKLNSHAELDFAAALAGDADLKAEAMTYRATLVDQVVDKCFVSKTHRSILESVLSQGG